MKKKIILNIFIALLLVVIIPTVAFAADYSVNSDTDLASLGLVAGDTVTIANNSTLRLYSSNASAIYDINIICQNDVDLTIENLRVATSSGGALDFSSGTNYLRLVGTNVFSSGTYYPGVKVEDMTALTISGTGSLTANGGVYGAGIGASGSAPGILGGHGGYITIQSGNVNANGGLYGAGIGGGGSNTAGDVDAPAFSSIGGVIVISGGSVTASGGDRAAGIGGGGTEPYPGLPASQNSNAGESITISSGTVNATGGIGASGIGGGSHGEGGIIAISGGTITAYGGISAAGIGGGSGADGGTITISDGVVNVNANTNGAGIGGGMQGPSGTIRITGGTINARSSSYGAAIGGGSTLSGNGGLITVEGGTITAYSTYRAAAIGAGYYSHGGTIRITGGNIVARYISSGYGAGIGTGQFGLGGSIQIEGGIIYAQGGSYGGAGIGGGANSEVMDIEISGGIVEARGQRAAGVGGGRYSNGGTIKLTGGLILTDTNYSAYNNIGAGQTTGTGTIQISGDTALFLNDNRSSTIITTTHAHYTNETFVSVSANSTAYGYNLPSYWTGNAYAWLPCHLVTYVAGANGWLQAGDATTENVLNGYSPANAPGAFPNSTYTFTGWYDGVTTSTNLNDFTITAPTTLTAVFGSTYVLGVTVDPVTATLVLGDADTTNDTVDLTETVTPANATNKDVTWSSSDISVATVDNNGLVTAVSEGTATITVTTVDGGHTATSEITVEQRALGISVIPVSATLVLDDPAPNMETIDLVEIITPSDATNKDVTWSSSDTSIATVDESGFVTAVKAGIATITVTTVEEGHSATSEITVLQRVTDVILDKNAVTYKQGVSDTLTCIVAPDDAYDRSVVWSVDNPAVATITVLNDYEILITAVGPGTANVTVTTNDLGYTDVCVVKVTLPEVVGGKKANLSCRLIYVDGTGVGEYIFTLYSNPRTEITSAGGYLRYDNVHYTNHVLVITTPQGIEIERYALVFTGGGKTGYEHKGNDIYLTFTPGTTNIDLLFMLNKNKDGVTFVDAKFVDNPWTGDYVR